MTANADLDPSISGAALQGMAAAYLQGQDPRQPTAAPLFGNLAGLPPLLLIAGDHEALRDARRRDPLRRARPRRRRGRDAPRRGGEVPRLSEHAGRVPDAMETCAQIGAFVRQNAA